MDLHLKNKVALVTGGSRGLGRAICLRLAQEGAAVAVNYRRHAAAAAEVVEQIRNTHGTRALALSGDVGTESDVDRMLQQIDAELGPLDILVNNASVCPTAWVRRLDRRTMDRHAPGQSDRNVPHVSVNGEPVVGPASERVGS